MNLLVDTATHFLCQHPKVMPRRAGCVLKRKSVKSLGFLAEWSESSANDIMRTDWMYLLEEAIVPLKKALIPVGKDLDENICQRVQNHESVISLKSFMLLFITEYDQDLSVVIACFAEKLSSICLQWLILILSYGEGNAAISTVEEEDIKKENVKEKSQKSILIVREDDGEIKGYRFKERASKMDLITALVCTIKKVFTTIEDEMKRMINKGLINLES
jgi:hypothetical protein